VLGDQYVCGIMIFECLIMLVLGFIMKVL
jgi:hypothetical protein